MIKFRNSILGKLRESPNIVAFDKVNVNKRFWHLTEKIKKCSERSEWPSNAIYQLYPQITSSFTFQFRILSKHVDTSSVFTSFSSLGDCCQQSWRSCPGHHVNRKIGHCWKRKCQWSTSKSLSKHLFSYLYHILHLSSIIDPFGHVPLIIVVQNVVWWSQEVTNDSLESPVYFARFGFSSHWEWRKRCS